MSGAPTGNPMPNMAPMRSPSRGVMGKRESRIDLYNKFDGSLAELSYEHGSKAHPYQHVDVYHVTAKGTTEDFRHGLPVRD